MRPRSIPARLEPVFEETHLSLTRAVAWTDHQHAVVIRFGADESATEHLRAKVHPTGQHGSAVRTEHEFFERQLLAEARRFFDRLERLAPASPGHTA